LLSLDSVENDVWNPLGIPEDTRNEKDYESPYIFFSYSMDDYELVAKMASILCELRHKYYFIYDPNKDLGKDTVEKSRKAVKNAPIVICVLSPTFFEKWSSKGSDKGANIRAEVSELTRKIRSNRKIIGKKIFFLQTEKYSETLEFAKKQKFPLQQLFNKSKIIIGSSLKTTSHEQLTKLLKTEIIDRNVRKTND
jgi:hypothetical protein